MVAEVQEAPITETPVVTFTDFAREKLVELIGEQTAAGKTAYLRIVVQGGGCAGWSYGMFFDNQQRPGDHAEFVDGVRVLVDEETRELIDGARVDYTESLLGRGFTVQNPNASSTCGCGSSFHVKGKKGDAQPCH